MIARFNDGPRCGVELEINSATKRFILAGRFVGSQSNPLTDNISLWRTRDVYELKSESDGVACYQFKETLED